MRKSFTLPTEYLWEKFLRLRHWTNADADQIADDELNRMWVMFQFEERYGITRGDVR